MKSSHRYGIASKLILMNILILLVFCGICGVTIYSFANIERLVTKIITTDISQNIENAGLLRELSGVFAEANHIAGIFIKNERVLNSQGTHLVRQMNELVAKNTDSRLKQPLKDFSLQLDLFFRQCGHINTVVRTLELNADKLLQELNGLDKTISEKRISLILKGYDPTILEQLAALTSGYHDTLQEINLQFERLIIEHDRSIDNKRLQPILSLIDDLNLRIQTLTASEPDIAAFGPRLSQNLRVYRKNIILYFQAMAEHRQQLTGLEKIKGQIIGIMNDIDRSIAQSTTSVSQHVNEIMAASRRFILIVSFAVIILTGTFTILFIFRTIRKPMSVINEGINALRSGNLDTEIRLNRNDEWYIIENALNRMAAELKGSYTELQDKNADLEFTQHELRDKVVELEKQVDARKRAEAELSRQHGRLEEMVRDRTIELENAQLELVKREKLAVLGQLTATVSHELRNPLGVIRSSAFYLLQKLGKSDEKITKHLDRIEKHVSVCDSIVGDLLEFTRGRLSEKVQGDINALLKETVALIRVPAGVSMVPDLSPDLPPIWFDREKMSRVMLNLIDNALYAVTMRLSKNSEARDYSPRIKLITRLSESNLRIDVEDNGIGMDAETASHAFEPLYTTRARGTGLGLAIVRKIVEEHDGSVSLESAVNSGTRVTLLIPAASQFHAEPLTGECSYERSDCEGKDPLGG